MKNGARLPAAISAGGLAGVLALPLVFASGCSGCTSYGPSHSDMVQATKQDAVGIISAKGGAAIENQYPQGNAYVVDLSGATIDDELLGHLKFLERISELNLSGSAITDTQFVGIVDANVLGTMFKLDMSDTSLSDASLQALSKQAMLGELIVTGSKVTPAGIEQFTKSRPRHPFGAKLKVTQ